MCIRDRPILTTEAINGNPGLSFDGVNDRLEDGDGEDYLEGLTAVSTFAVVNSDTISQDRSIFHTATNPDKEAPWGLRLDPNGSDGRTGTLRAGLNSGNGNKFYEADGSGLIKASPQVLGLSWASGTAPTFYVEGRAIDPDPNTAESGALDGVDFVRLGSSPITDSQSWQGDISEVIFYETELSTVDSNKVESYLALKYGLTLSQATAQDYTASNGTKMWDKHLSLIHISEPTRPY